MIFKQLRPSSKLATPLFIVLAFVAFWSARSRLALAADDRTLRPEEDDYSSTPFTEYGEFQNEDEEAEDLKFYQYGRLFGVGLGIGQAGATGNRGRLFNGGFPAIDIRTTYWFDFNTALDLTLLNFKWSFAHPAVGNVSSSVTEIGLDLKYYFDVTNLGATLSFCNPFIVFGVGEYTYSRTFSNTTDSTGAAQNIKDHSFGINGGLGLEFALKPKKVYFDMVGKFHSVVFSDTDANTYAQTNAAGQPIQPYIPNQEGLFYTVIGSFLFTW